jgi:two-component system OmpR family sensor kinase
MSLRARLVLTLVALAAVGMVTLGAVTYATQRSFQEDRIDDQTLAAEPAISRQLDEARGFDAGHGIGGPDGPRPGRPGGRPDPRQANLPPGTYGEYRDAAGTVYEPVVISYGQDPLPAPDLPDELEPGRLFTVDAVSGGGRYRVRTIASPRTGGTVVVAIPLGGVEETLQRLLNTEGLVIAAVLALLAAAALALVRAGLRPLERIAATADDIAAGDLSHRATVDSPRTEVGRLGTAFNAMLERVEEAFAERAASEGRLRQFLSDASHELRTPLASIRGYAELFRIGAARSPQDTEKAMRRIEEETTRMGVLVEDLLVLARLDEVRDPVREPVDVSVLARDAAADAAAVDPERSITTDLAAEAVVRADADQLRQVLANLVRNALVHTPTGTAIDVCTTRENGQVRLEVRDHGPGLPPGDPDALFERFWRSESGRERGRAGAGLGLAIVAGIVHAHGGDVRAADAPGGGASFVVTLPAAG